MSQSDKKIKKVKLLVTIFILSLVLPAHSHAIYQITHTNENPNNQDDFKSHNFDCYHQQSLPTTCKKNHTGIQEIVFTEISSGEFQKIFSDNSQDPEIIKHLEFFANQKFLAHVRTFDCYDSIIINLKNKIDCDKSFRKKTKNIPGFTYSHFLWKEKSGFHDFINREAAEIKQKRVRELDKLRQQEEAARKQQEEREFRQKYCLHINKTQELDVLIKSYKQHVCALSKNSDFSKRLIERIQAIEKTRQDLDFCFDYSSYIPQLKKSFCDQDLALFNNTVGTYLDCQLHKELLQTKNTLVEFQDAFSHNFHAGIIAPVVDSLVAQAKAEHKISQAFELSDICYALVNTLSKGVQAIRNFSCAVIKGSGQGICNVLSLDHWKEMATGALQLGVFFLGAVGQEQALQDAVLTMGFSKNNSPEALKHAEEYSLHTQAQIKAVKNLTQRTYTKLSCMPWEKLVEHGAELGVTMILDTLLLHAISGITSSTGRAFLKEINSTLDKGLLFTQEHAIEVAGLGKLVIKEGVEGAKVADHILQETPKVLKNKIKNVTQVGWKARNAIQGRGKEFEDLLVKKLGGDGSFKVTSKIAGTREFDGRIGNIWYEAKSGQYWDLLKADQRALAKFRERMGTGLTIAREHGAQYRLYSNTPIPQEIKIWLQKKGIPFFEFLKGK